MRAYKTQLHANDKQHTFLNKCAGISRLAYNWSLDTWNSMYLAHKEDEELPKPSAYGIKKQFNAIKYTEWPFVVEVPPSITEAAILNMGKAWTNFFRKSRGDEGRPKFKSRYNDAQSFQLRGVRIFHDSILIPWRNGSVSVRLAESGYLPTTDSELKFGVYTTISRRAGKWFVSVLAGEPTEFAHNGNDWSLGIDLGLKTRAMLSTGEAIDTPKPLYAAERNLKRIQRELSRRTKGGQNWQKTKAKLQKAHYRVANIRSHWTHALTHYVCDVLQPGYIVLEDLNVKGMMRNHRLAKAMGEANFGEIRRQIEYKAKRNGIEIIMADRFFPSSKTCNHCGAVKKDLTLADRIFVCPECGYTIDRDLNAALNLARLGENRKASGDCLGS